MGSQEFSKNYDKDLFKNLSSGHASVSMHDKKSRERNLIVYK